MGNGWNREKLYRSLHCKLSSGGEYIGCNDIVCPDIAGNAGIRQGEGRDIYQYGALEGLSGDKIQVTLTNSQKYPHNNSKKTVQLPVTKNNMKYTITCEVVEVTGGAVGEFEFTDKLLNGFKIAYTGSASKVIVNCYVRGGV